MRPDSPSYVARDSDRRLYDALNGGEFAYILTSRQMGKSSLIVRTAAKLRDDGVAVAALDLTALGQNLAAEQWYAGLLSILGKRLDLEDELEDFWEENEQLGPLHRWMDALREVVLTRVTGRLVVFIDEIDVVQSLPFATGEFFAAIRECYTRRAEESELERLTFCLVGVATPAQLIDDALMTPFNIGVRIELRDFQPDDAPLLARGLELDEARATDVVGRALHWTGGHPYLTQRLCQLARRAECSTAREVDEIVAAEFFSERAREQEPNLQFAHNSMLGRDVDIAGLLGMYRRVLRGKRARNDETNPLVSVLRLSGIVRVAGRELRVRNPIYARVFDQRWVTENMPDAEVRRQKAAHRRGVLHAVLGASALLAVVVGLLVFALRALDDASASQAMLRTENGIHRLQSGEAAGLLDIASAYEATDDPETRRLVALHWAHWEGAYRGRLQAMLHSSASPKWIFTHDGRHLLMRSDEGILRWTHDGDRWVEREMESKEAVSDILVAEAGDTILSLPGLPTARPRTHSATTGAALAALPKDATRLALSGPGAYVALRDASGAASVYDAHTGESVAGPWPWDPTARHVSFQFAPDESALRHVTQVTDGDGATTRIVSRSVATGDVTGEPIDLVDAGNWRQVALSDGALLWSWETSHGNRYQIRDEGTLDPITDPRPFDRRHLTRIGRQPYARLQAVGVTVPDPVIQTVVLVDASGREHPTGLQPWSHNFSSGFREHIAIDLGTGDVASPIRIWPLTEDGGALDLPTPQGGIGSEDGGPLLSADDRILVGQRRGQYHIWDVARRRRVGPPLPHPGLVENRCFRPGAHELLTELMDTRVRVAYLWDARGDARLHTEREAIALTGKTPTSGSGTVAWSDDGSLLATSHRRGGEHGAVHARRLWRWSDGELNIDEAFASRYDDLSPSRDGYRSSLAFVPGTTLVGVPAPRRDGSPMGIALWDTSKGQPLSHVVSVSAPGRTPRRMSLAFSPDGSLAALAGGRATGEEVQGYAALFGAADGARVGDAHHAEDDWYFRMFTDVTFSPDGSWVVASDGVGRVFAWRVATFPDDPQQFGHDGVLQRGPTAYVTSVAFSPDSAYLVTGSEDATARVWSVGDWKPVGRPLEQHREVSDVAFSPDGRIVATGGGEGSTQLWDFATGQPLGREMHHPAGVTSLAFHPSGRWLATMCNDGNLRVWSVPTVVEDATTMRRQTWRTLGMRRDDSSGELRALTKAEWAEVREME